MGLMAMLLNGLFGGGRNVVRETVEVFRENTEASAQRGAEMRGQALAQHASEFSHPEKGGFDRFMDGVNRLPRPALALGIVALFVAAMIDPIWFSARMQGLALVPEPLWWLLGVIVSFYFGARHQTKGQEFQRSIAQTLVRTPQVVRNLHALDDLARDSAQDASDAQMPAPIVDENAALAAWKTQGS